MRLRLILTACCLWLFAWGAGDETDTQRLGRAVEYFQGGKYHEAMLLFEELNSKYNLNPRFNGYLAVCYYHEFQYEDAAALLDKVMPRLEVFAPHERAVYYFTCADSHFQTGEYSSAIPYYEKALSVCYENEKPEIYYKMSFCHMKQNDDEKAQYLYGEAESYFELYHYIPTLRTRIGKMSNIVDSCQQWIASLSLPVETPVVRDTLHNEVPTEINLEDIYGSGIEIEEDE